MHSRARQHYHTRHLQPNLIRLPYFLAASHVTKNTTKHTPDSCNLQEPGVCFVVFFLFLCPLNPRNGQKYDHKQKEFETTPFYSHQHYSHNSHHSIWARPWRVCSNTNLKAPLGTPALTIRSVPGKPRHEQSTAHRTDLTVQNKGNFRLDHQCCWFVWMTPPSAGWVGGGAPYFSVLALPGQTRKLQKSKSSGFSRAGPENP